MSARAEFGANPTFGTMGFGSFLTREAKAIGALFYHPPVLANGLKLYHRHPSVIA